LHTKKYGIGHNKYKVNSKKYKVTSNKYSTNNIPLQNPTPTPTISEPKIQHQQYTKTNIMLKNAQY
jgi:hypothetical protein